MANMEQILLSCSTVYLPPTQLPVVHRVVGCFGVGVLTVAGLSDAAPGSASRELRGSPYAFGPVPVAPFTRH